MKEAIIPQGTGAVGWVGRMKGFMAAMLLMVGFFVLSGCCMFRPMW